MKNIVVSLLLGFSLSFTTHGNVQAQKKPLDIQACLSWKNVEMPEISPAGRWVTYRIVPMEYDPNSEERKF
ncbi:secreted protein, partial [gut metagenome]